MKNLTQLTKMELVEMLKEAWEQIEMQEQDLLLSRDVEKMTREENEKLTRIHKDYKTMLMRYSDENLELYHEIEKFQNEIEGYKEAIDYYAETADDFKHIMGDLEAEIDQLEKRNECLQKGLEEKEDLIREMDCLNWDLVHENNDLKEENRVLKQENKVLIGYYMHGKDDQYDQWWKEQGVKTKG